MCRNTHIILQFIKDLHMPSTHAKKKCFGRIADKHEFRQYTCVFGGDVAYAWILALVRWQEGDTYGSHELQLPPASVALSCV